VLDRLLAELDRVELDRLLAELDRVELGCVAAQLNRLLPELDSVELDRVQLDRLLPELHRLLLELDRVGSCGYCLGGTRREDRYQGEHPAGQGKSG
jgi:hypothetical protein